MNTTNRKTKKVKKQSYIHEHRKFWTDRIKGHIKETKEMGYSLSLKFSCEKQKQHKKFFLGSYDIYLNDRYVTCVLINKDDNLLNSKKLGELDHCLMVMNRTLLLLGDFRRVETYKNKYYNTKKEVTIKV